MNERFYELLNSNLKFEQNRSMYPPLTLAYLGDAVFEILVRSKVLNDNNTSVNILHKKAKCFVKAEAQAKMYHKIKDILNEDELSILKRGRNAKSYTSSKNTSIINYRHATGIEALFGYLFLNGYNDRMIEIFNRCIED